jgi:NCAIR mutase (PurE)-related protein
LGYARLDHHRELRTGFPEVVFCQGKTVEQVAEIFVRLAAKSKTVLGTRASLDAFNAVKERCPDAVYHQLARCIVIPSEEECEEKGDVLVASAGTADMPVAEEAAVSAETMGLKVSRLYDVGVAGIHRLLEHSSLLQQASVVIVVAGMEGALASVVGGLTKRPIIAVPTSVGYGANFGGLSALLAMLNSCASGVGVVNIDNGFGAASLAYAIVDTGRGHKT